MKLSTLIIAAALGFGGCLVPLLGSAQAQDLGNCPAGMRTTFNNGQPTCMADDTAPSTGSDAPSRAPSAEEIAASMYGPYRPTVTVGSGMWAAVAVKGGQFFEVGNYSNPRGAVEAVLSECQEQSSIAGECALQTAFNVGYAAILRDQSEPLILYVGQGETKAVAAASALEKCRQAGGDCSAQSMETVHHGGAPGSVSRASGGEFN